MKEEMGKSEKIRGQQQNSEMLSWPVRKVRKENEKLKKKNRIIITYEIRK